MILIAHRGNINGPNPERENDPKYLQRAVYEGYDIEVDLWYTDHHLWLGHDEPTYKIDMRYFVSSYGLNTWFHCKNAAALGYMVEAQRILPGLKYFWHQTDDYTVTSNGKIWTYPGKPLPAHSVAVLPEQHYTTEELKYCYGICSDYIGSYNAL